MKLQILVPQYDEGDDVLRNLLDSVAIQQSVDMSEVGVIIVNDGSDTLLDEARLSSYPFKVKYIKAEHRGVSATRNAALDAAIADYVMFCDADDMFYNACGLYIVFREMVEGFDVLISKFIEESRNPMTQEPLYVDHEMDSTFVHGKIFRREYLLENNIRWNDSLTIHEDSYFNCLAQRMTESMKYCFVPFYLWKWRDASVCRHDPKYILKTYNNMLESNSALVRELQARGKEVEARSYVGGMIYDAYYTMNKPEWLNQENQEYRNATELRFKEYFEEFQKTFEDITLVEKAQLITGIKNRFMQEGVFLEVVTFDDWINHIKTL